MLRKLILVTGIAAALAACGGGGSSPTQNKMSPTSATMAVQVGDDFFSPQSMQVNPGDTVQWTLVGNLLVHTVTDSGGAFDSGVGFLNHPGATFSHTFTSADSGKTFSYFCQTHVSMGMKGDIKVGSNAPPPKPGY